jgi:hypothetical protein
MSKHTERREGRSVSRGAEPDENLLGVAHILAVCFQHAQAAPLPVADLVDLLESLSSGARILGNPLHP